MISSEKSEIVTAKGEKCLSDGYVKPSATSEAMYIVRKMAREKEVEANGGIVIRSHVPKHRLDVVKWNGWGYKDTEIEMIDSDDKTCTYRFTGNRYEHGMKRMPHLSKYITDTYGYYDKAFHLSQPQPVEEQIPPSIISEKDLNDIMNLDIVYSTVGMERFIRGKGQSWFDLLTARTSMLKRVPDIVLWPLCHDDVVKVVNLAHEKDMVVVPYGGGTAVTGALNCPDWEKRTIISLDMSQMNNILWINEDNMTACIEAGVMGKDLEDALSQKGFTMGHEPDSMELSTLGGWIATRASGMKKNKYGNIEDIVVHAKMVTTEGILDKHTTAPRTSTGPDFNHIIMGSEGTLGVITEAIVKLRPVPECETSGCFLFPDFESGFRMMREVAMKRCQPVAFRLVDNGQFNFGFALSTEKPYHEELLQRFKLFLLTQVKRYDLKTISAMIVMHEGSYAEVAREEKNIRDIAARYGGIAVGGNLGKEGYEMIFLIGYLRDLGYNNKIIGESFETSVSWDKCLSLIQNVKNAICKGCKERGIKLFDSNYRVTQTYDTGCVVYFYFGFLTDGVDNSLGKYRQIEDLIREEVFQNEGSLSHHHGVGKLKAEWYSRTVSEMGVALYEATKSKLDPKNIFGVGNILIPKGKESEFKNLFL